MDYPPYLGLLFLLYRGQARDNGKIPFPFQGGKMAGGHAIVAVGYDDNAVTKNNICEKETKVNACFICLTAILPRSIAAGALG